MTASAARISHSCWDCDCWKLLAVPPKLPRTLVGRAMSASACAMMRCASPRVAPSSRLNDRVLESSPSSWSMLEGTARSDKVATVASGTMVVALVLSGWPVDAPRWPGLAEVPVLPDVGRYRSFSATGPWAKRGAHSITTAYWFSSSKMVATERWPNALYSALSTAAELIPRREALSRSTSTKVSTPLSAWSVSMSLSCGSCFRRSASLVVQVRSVAWLSPLRVYW